MDILKFIYHMRRIFVYFRTHGKDMPARDAEKIDNRILSTSELRTSIFNFLVERGVFFRSEYLYKINLEKMSNLGINWAALPQNDRIKLQSVYDLYCAWKAEQ